MQEEKKVYYGEVLFFDPKRGYGFAQWDNEGVKQRDIFIHFSDINMEGFKTLYKAQKISFSLGVNKHGAPKAIEVAIVKA